MVMELFLREGTYWQLFWWWQCYTRYYSLFSTSNFKQSWFKCGFGRYWFWRWLIVLVIDNPPVVKEFLNHSRINTEIFPNSVTEGVLLIYWVWCFTFFVTPLSLIAPTVWWKFRENTRFKSANHDKILYT